MIIFNYTCNGDNRDIMERSSIQLARLSLELSGVAPMCFQQMGDRMTMKKCALVDTFFL